MKLQPKRTAVLAASSGRRWILRKAERAWYIAAKCYYGRDVKALLVAPTFDLLDPDVMQRLRGLHPDNSEPVKCLLQGKLPDAPTLSKTQLHKIAKKLQMKRTISSPAWASRLCGLSRRRCLRWLTIMSPGPKAEVSSIDDRTSAVGPDDITFNHLQLLLRDSPHNREACARK